MAETAIAGPKEAERSFGAKLWNVRAELLWTLAIGVVLLSTVDWVLLVGIGMAIATVVAAGLGFRELLHRADQDDAERAIAPGLGPVPGGREPRATSAPTGWRRHDAA